MLTALLTVENILDDAGHDVWTVNVEEDYHEEQRTASSGAAFSGSGSSGSGTGRDAPVLPRRSPDPSQSDPAQPDPVRPESASAR